MARKSHGKHPQDMHHSKKHHHAGHKHTGHDGRGHKAGHYDTPGKHQMRPSVSGGVIKGGSYG